MTAALALRGGRVIDPESGFDAVADVAVDGGRITAIVPGGLIEEGAATLDATGCIVTAGFIDLHSHAQSIGGHRLQACDGVTTALDLEAGVAPVEVAYQRAAAEGRPLHHGWSASWAAVRMHVLAGVPLDGRLATTFASLGIEAWQAEARPADVDRIMALLEQELAAGALGIGVMLGYAQGTTPDEYLRVAALAARAGVPTFTHARDLVETRPDVAVDGAEEIVRAAAQTGAHMHYCHVTSTSTHHVDRVLALIDRVRREGAHVTVETYPYGAGLTAVSAEFLAPDRLPLRGLGPRSLTYLPTGERIADVARLEQLRAVDPGGPVLVDFLDDARAEDRAVIRRALSFDGAMVASDAVWLTDATGAPAGEGPDALAWPLPRGLVTHPRTAGTFARSLRVLVDDVGEPWPRALARCSLLPAQTLQAAVPALARKGRLQVGADADVVVFEPDRLADQATYADTTRPATGVVHLLVGGQAVIRGGELDVDALPGRPVRR